MKQGMHISPVHPHMHRFSPLPHRLQAMSQSLGDLTRALSGEIGFSSTLEELSAALFNGKLPALWARLTPATEKPLGSWMLWFQRRARQYRSWLEQGEPKVMWLSGLHTPETYIAALVQAACRCGQGCAAAAVEALHSLAEFQPHSGRGVGVNANGMHAFPCTATGPNCGTKFLKM